MPYTHILVAVDLTEECREVIQRAQARVRNITAAAVRAIRTVGVIGSWNLGSGSTVGASPARMQGC